MFLTRRHCSCGIRLVALYKFYICLCLVAFFFYSDVIRKTGIIRTDIEYVVLWLQEDAYEWGGAGTEDAVCKLAEPLAKLARAAKRWRVELSEARKVRFLSMLICLCVSTSFTERENLRDLVSNRIAGLGASEGTPGDAKCVTKIFGRDKNK